MYNASSLITVKSLQAASPDVAPRKTKGWLRLPFAASLTPARVRPVAYSFADQAFAVGGGFLANVVLARTQTKEAYGTFALTYSVFTFLAGLHNAAILEPFTIYGSGRYRARFAEYFRLMARSNALVGILLTESLLCTYFFLRWAAPQLVSRALLGLGIAVGSMLSGAFLRRSFYLQRNTPLATRTSLVFFATVAGGLWLTWKANRLDCFSVYLILALGWIVAGASSARKLPWGTPAGTFMEFEPRYWREHWKYARWVFATAFVFQVATQGYYWFVAGLLSVKEVAKLKAMYVLVAPMDQIFSALAFLVLPVLASHHAARTMKAYFSLWKRYALATAGVAVLFALAVRILGKTAMHLLYAGKFDGLAPQLYLLALLPLLTGIGTTIANALNAAEKPSLVFYAYLSSGAVTFLLGLPLVTHFGLRGAVYGMLLSGSVFTGALALGYLFNIFDETNQTPGVPPLQVDARAEDRHLPAAARR